MTDTSDYWNATKEYKRARKDAYRANMPKVLKLIRGRGFELKQFSDEHYRCGNGTVLVDWWPSTGYWKQFKGTSSGHEVRALIEFLEVSRKNSP